MNTHKIRTIEDLVYLANGNNIDGLLTDLRNFILLAKMQDPRNKVVNPACFYWNNDGTNDLSYDCSNMDNDEIQHIVKQYGYTYDSANNKIKISTKG